MNSLKSWVQNLKKASFKGIPFEVESHQSEFGRRIVSHSFPYKDKPYNEDLGKKQRSLQITGFLVGDNYFAKRDKLIEAVEKGKSGELIHPYLGSMEVECASISVSESHTKGRFCSIQFTFLETGTQLPLKVTENKIAKVFSACAQLTEKSQKSFENKFSALNASSKYLHKMQDAIKSSMSGIKNAEKFVSSVTQLATDLSYVVRNVNSSIHKTTMFTGNISSLIYGAFCALDSCIKGSLSDKNKKAMAKLIPTYAMPGMFQMLFKNDHKNDSATYTKVQLAEQSYKKILAYKSMFKMRLFFLMQNRKRSPDEIKVDQNIYELEILIKIFTICAWCEMVTTATFLSVNDINKARDDIAEAIDSLMHNKTIDDEVYDMLYQLRSRIYDNLNSIANKLPVIYKVKIRYRQTLLNFCFEQFGNLDKENEILYLNNIKNPEYLFKGQILKVIA
ncbi:DNA circularization protein [Silvanigrella aquatica]|uniref:DNA circulation N-terminal domain-containing protein n=1 Tax=Silvanigrella aquatica TaxID=1915309 RepID=A0A1L4D179_9BACT|nr:DNA circularization N-terminal domain-containing protein [Silvanigrella aquatica]APJ03940.1 hypothetical protein AXG55_08490 [Silvanigrella aquatica]